MRLIDADMLIEKFDQIAEGKIERIVGVNCESLTDKMSQIVRIARENGEKQTFKNFIDEQPTAYDIDWILMQLEKFKELECGDTDEDIELYELGRSQGKLEAYLNAIEIVKKGGNV